MKTKMMLSFLFPMMRKTIKQIDIALFLRTWCSPHCVMHDRFLFLPFFSSYVDCIQNAIIEAYLTDLSYSYIHMHFHQNTLDIMLRRLSPKGPDPVTSTWFLCGSPWAAIIITIGYLLSLYYGKRWMSNRSKPFNLRVSVAVYNFLAVLINGYVALLAIRTISLKSYRIYCQGVMHDKEDIYLAKAIWLYYISKGLEFWDTWFFILNKKFSHITVLHVYHHATMFPMWYLSASVFLKFK